MVSLVSRFSRRSPLPPTLSVMMNLRALAKRWSVEAAQGIATLSIAFTFLATLAAGSSPIQSTEFGVTVFAFGLAVLVHYELKLLSKFPSAQPWWFSGSWLDRSHGLAIAVTFVLPLAVSALANDSLRAAFNPIGYWKSELKDAKTSDCSVYKEMLANSAESLQVAQNKYNMGIATTSEIRSAASAVQLVRGAYQSCESSAQARVDRANTRLAELMRK